MSDGSVYSGMTVKVTPEILKSTASTASGHINEMVRIFESMDQLVSRSQSYWLGDAGDLHRKSYESRKEDVRLALNRLKEHPVKLTQITQVYGDAERATTEMAAALPSDALI